MKRVLVILNLSLFITILLPFETIFAALPEFSEEEEVYIIESSSNSSLINQNSDKEIEIGDIADLLISKVAIESLQGKLSSSITVSKEDLEFLDPDESGIFVEGQTLTYQDLINILLLTSNDNAAKIIGIDIGRKLSGSDETDNTEALKVFIDKLNSKCKDLKLKKTEFSEVIGEGNKTNPVDLTLITKDVLSDKTIQSIINSDSYELKLKAPSTDSEQDKDNSKSKKDSNKEKIITIENKDSYLLSVINTEHESKENKEETNESNPKNQEVQSDLTESETEESKKIEEKENPDSKSVQTKEETNNNPEEIAYEVNLIEEVATKNNADSKISTTGYFTNLNSEDVTGVFLSTIKDAQIVGTISNSSSSNIANQISEIVTECKNNYGFIDLKDSDILKETYSISNAHFSSSKDINLSGIDSTKAYLPISNSKPEMKITWNEDYVIPTGNNYELKKSIEPLTQIANLEIKSDNQSQTIPLYNTDKLTVKNWTDGLLKYGLISFIVLVILLILWRLIYVHNRRKVLRRQRLRRIKRKRQLQARRLAIQRAKNQSS